MALTPALLLSDSCLRTHAAPGLGSDGAIQTSWSLSHLSLLLTIWESRAGNQAQVGPLVASQVTPVSGN